MKVPTSEDCIDQSCEHMLPTASSYRPVGTRQKALYRRKRTRAVARDREGAPSRRPATPRSAPAAKNYTVRIATVVEIKQVCPTGKGN